MWRNKGAGLQNRTKQMRWAATHRGGGVSQRGGGVSVMFFCSSLSCSVAVLPCRLQVAWLVCWQAGGLVDQSGALSSRATSGGGVFLGAREGGWGRGSCCRCTLTSAALCGRVGCLFSHHVVLQWVYLRGVVLTQDLVVLVFGGQRVVDVQGVVLFGRSLHRILQLVLGIGIILTREGRRRMARAENTVRTAAADHLRELFQEFICD